MQMNICATVKSRHGNHSLIKARNDCTKQQVPHRWAWKYYLVSSGHTMVLLTSISNLRMEVDEWNFLSYHGIVDKHLKFENGGR